MVEPGATQKLRYRRSTPGDTKEAQYLGDPLTFYR